MPVEDAVGKQLQLERKVKVLRQQLVRDQKEMKYLRRSFIGFCLLKALTQNVAEKHEALMEAKRSEIHSQCETLERNRAMIEELGRRSNLMVEEQALTGK